jgi:hypothetical protein
MNDDAGFGPRSTADVIFHEDGNEPDPVEPYRAAVRNEPAEEVGPKPRDGGR